MRKILIVIDVQNDFVTGSLGSDMALAIVQNVKTKIAEYEQRKDIVIFTRDTHHDDYLETQEGRNLPIKHCIAETSGWEIYKDIDKACFDCRYVNKPTFGWGKWQNTFATIIGDVEADVDEIELVGLCTDICVVTNALILKTQFPEKKITVDASCCAGVTEESHRAALLTMKMCQVNVINEEAI